MPSSRRGVGHAVGVAIDVGDLMMVPIMALVGAREPAEVGGRFVGRDRPLAETAYGGGVVGESCRGLLADVI